MVYYYRFFGFKSNHNSQLSILNSQLILFIECLFEGRELRLTSNTAFPPRLDESEAVAHELYVG